MSVYLLYVPRLVVVGALASFSFAIIVLSGLTITQISVGSIGLGLFLVCTLFCALFFIVSVRAFVFVLLFLQNPSKYLLMEFANNLSTKTFEEFEDMVEIWARKVNIRHPKIRIVQGLPIALTYGISRNKTYMVVSENLIEKLDRDELEAAVLHELYHVKYGDVEARTVLFANRKMFHPQYIKFLVCFGTSFVIWFSVFTILVSMVPFLVMETPIIISGLEYMLPIIVGAVSFASLLVLVDIWKGNIGLDRYIFQDELLADGFAVTLGSKPAKLLSAILFITGQKQVPELSSDSSSFSELIKRKFFDEKILAYIRDLLTLKRTLFPIEDYVLERMPYRFDFIKMIENRMLGNAKLIIISLDQKELKRNSPKTVNDFVKMHKAQFACFLE